MHRSEFDTAALLFDMLARDLIQVASVEETAPPDPILAMQKQLELGARSLREKRFELALRAFEAVLTLDRLNQEAKKGLIAVVEAKSRERALRSVPLDKVPSLQMDFAELTRQSFDPQEGFVLSRVNGQWDVRSILKLCPMAEEDALLIFARLLERKAIALG